MLPFALELEHPRVALCVAIAGALLLLRARPGSRHVPRALFVLVAALAASDPRARDPDPPRLRVFVVDRSRSFEGARVSVSQALAQGARDLDPARDKVAVVAFGARPLVALEPASPGEIGEGARLALAAKVDETSSDLGAALDLALDVARPEPASCEVVLLTDGRDTAGRVREAAARAAAAGVTLDAIAPGSAPLPNARIARVQAPARVAVGEAARLEVDVESNVAGRLATSVEVPDGVELVGDGAIRDACEEDVPLHRTFVVRPTRPGLFRVRARVVLEDQADAFPDDDVLEAVFLAGSRSRAALVGESAAWKGLLETAGFEVELVSTTDLPRALTAWTPPADLVVLNEIPASEVPTADLRRYLESGGGLVASGDLHAFGPGEYGESELEALLPVRSGPPDSRSKPLALEIVLDASGSMEKRFVQAVDAVIPSTREIRKTDSLRIITFSDKPKDRSLEEVRGVTPGGSTDIGRAVEKGLEELAQESGRRLLILVTDGEDEKVKDQVQLSRIHEKAEKLGADFEAALIVIGEKPGETFELLRRAIGEKHASIHSVKEADATLARLVKGDLIEGSRHERRTGSFVTVEGGHPIGSYAPVRPKEFARTRISLHDPARERPAALAVTGERVLAVATDLETGGASLAGEGRPLLLDLIREVARRDARDLELEAERTPGWIRIKARTSRSALTAALEGERVPLRPVAPGELEARLRAPRDAALVSVLEGEAPIGAVSVPAESSLELAPPRRDLELLEALALPTGGVVLPELLPLPRPKPKETAQRALSKDLAFAALALFVLEGVLTVTLERLAARRAARRTFEST